MDEMRCPDCDLAIDRGDGVCLSGHVVAYDDPQVLETHLSGEISDLFLRDTVMVSTEIDLLNDLLRTMDPRASYAVLARFGLLEEGAMSFREVGESLGVTAEAARRLVSRAVAGLRDDAEQVISNTGGAVAPPEQEQVAESTETVTRGRHDASVKD